MPRCNANTNNKSGTCKEKKKERNFPGGRTTPPYLYHLPQIPDPAVGKLPLAILHWLANIVLAGKEELRNSLNALVGFSHLLVRGRKSAVGHCSTICTLNANKK